MKPITEQEKQELIKHCKRVMNESSPDGLEYPMAEIALASLTATPVGWKFTNKTNGVTWVSHEDDRGLGYTDVPVYTAPPVPVVKLPDEISFSGWGGGCNYNPEDADGVMIGWNNCLAEIKRLNNIN